MQSENPQPLYQKVKDYIEKQILEGTWQPDTKIPSEKELVETMGVSRMTANRAVRELTGKGLLIRLQGVGTFVTHRKPRFTLLEIKSIAAEIKKRGGIHSSDIHLLQEEKAPQEIAKEMELLKGDPVFHSILIHRDRGKAIQIADRYVNPAIAPDYLKQDYSTMTPSEYLLKVAEITEAEHTIEAIMPDKETQRLLDIDHNEPCLVLHRKTWTQSLIATKSKFVYPGSRYRIGDRFKPSTNTHTITG